MKLSTIHIITIIILSICLTSCSDSPKELKIAEQIMEVYPDSSLHILKKLSPDKYFSDADRALYGFLLFKTLDKCNMTLQPDSLIDFSIKYYSKENDKIQLGNCYMYKGRMLLNRNKYEQAASEYVKALDYLKEETDYNVLGKIHSDMGAICSLQQQYYEARKKYKLAVIYFSKSHKKNAVYSSMLNIGVTYRCTRDFNTALKYYHKVLFRTKDSTTLGIAYQEIGNSYIILKQPDSAIHYLKKSLQFQAKETDYAIRYCLLADTYTGKNMNDSAEIYTQESLKYPANFITRRNCYKTLAHCTFLKGNIKLMGKYISKYQEYSDSIRTIGLQTKATIIEDLHKNSVETDGVRHRLAIIIPFSFLTILLSGLIFYYLFNRNKLKKLELEDYKNELYNKQIFVNQSISNKINDSRAIHSTIRKNAIPTEKVKLDREFYTNNLHIDDWTSFTNEMNHAFNNIVDKLQSKYPLLSRKEISWCCLHLLNIPSADRILILETTNEGLYKIKQRIAQKLDLKSSRDLDPFLKDIVSEQV